MPNRILQVNFGTSLRLNYPIFDSLDEKIIFPIFFSLVMSRVIMGASAKWCKTTKPISGHQNASANRLQVVRLAKLSLVVLLAKMEALANTRTVVSAVYVKVITLGLIADRIHVIQTLANPRKAAVLSTQVIMNVRRTSLKKLKPSMFKLLNLSNF